MPLTVSGRQKVKTLKDAFKNEFGVTIRVYHGVRFADDNDTLASIRSDGAPGKGDFEVHGNTKVGNVEKQFLDGLGIKVKLENANGELADKEISLSQLKAGPETPAKEKPPAKDVAPEKQASTREGIPHLVEYLKKKNNNNDLFHRELLLEYSKDGFNIPGVAWKAQAEGRGMYSISKILELADGNVTEIKISGKKILRTINKDFQEQYPCLGLAFFTQEEWDKIQKRAPATPIDGGQRLSEVRTVPPPKDEKELSIHGRTLVKNLEDKFHEIYGLKVKVIYKKGKDKYYSHDNDLTLTQLNKKREDEGCAKYPA
jgi:hypothetical protein